MGEHLVRYYGHYSNKARGLRAKQGDQNENDQSQPVIDSERTNSARKRFRVWAMLIDKATSFL